MTTIVGSICTFFNFDMEFTSVQLHSTSAQNLSKKSSCPHLNISCIIFTVCCPHRSSSLLEETNGGGITSAARAHVLNIWLRRQLWMCRVAFSLAASWHSSTHRCRTGQAAEVSDVIATWWSSPIATWCFSPRAMGLSTTWSSWFVSNSWWPWLTSIPQQHAHQLWRPWGKIATDHTYLYISICIFCRLQLGPLAANQNSLAHWEFAHCSGTLKK